MRRVVLLMLVVFSGGVQSGDVLSTKITRVLAGPTFQNKVFVTLSNKATGTPACKTNPGNDFVFVGSTEQGKMHLSIVMAAYLAEKDVAIGGTNLCDIYGDVESLAYIHINP